MIIEYIRRKLTQLTSSEAENDRLNALSALYDIAAHGRVFPRSRLTACAMLSYISRVKEDDSLIDGQINQQAIGFKGG